MSEIKLEVAKKYRNRRGEVVEIISKRPVSNNYPFNGSDARNYAQNGRYVRDRESGTDLIEEVIEPAKKPHKRAKEIHAIANGVDVEGKGSAWGGDAGSGFRAKPQKEPTHWSILGAAIMGAIFAALFYAGVRGGF